ncbi:MAG TPA: galactokinase [Gemmatimonadaceae bacterium]|nr:galactokinase [Gemmatimonadaceae bacterium]
MGSHRQEVNAAGARDYFRETFGGLPDIIGSAPGRVNIIGEHTDYNGGQVLPIAIDRRTFVAIRARPGSSVSRIVSPREPTVAEFDVRRIAASGQWWDYMTGVCAAMESAGARVPQFEAVVQSDVPMGSGLSSSAALEVATALSLARIVSEPPDMKKLALLSWRVETQFVGVASGVMDQFASALCLEGHALHLWCDTLETEQVTMPDAVLIFDTNSPRELRASQFNQRRAECEEALAVLRRSRPSLLYLAAASLEEIRLADLTARIRKRAVHVVEENARVEKLVMQLMQVRTVAGELLYQSHESLRDNYECSTPELDWFVDSVRGKPGVTGARLTGAGWGGCAIAVGELDALAGAADDLAAQYEARFGRKPGTWLTRAGSGARIEDLSS